MTPHDTPHWPPALPRRMTLPATTVYENLAQTATRYPQKAALVFGDYVLTYASLREQVDALAGFLETDFGVGKGDRVLLNMQNCPQFVIAYYAVARAGAVVVPVNPMYRRDEVAHLLEDTGAQHAVCGKDRLAEVLECGVRCHNILLVDYGDAGGPPIESGPDAPESPAARIVAWHSAIAAAREPSDSHPQPDDLCMLMYSSGTTGRPKGCMHTHQNMSGMAASVSAWMRVYPDSVMLLTVPLFHIAGMQNMMHAPIFSGATVVIAPRWNRDAACELTDRHQVTHWTMMPTMIIDILSNPRLGDYSLRSVARIGGGGAAMPEAVSEALERKWGIRFLEGYGLTESGHALSNPPQAARRQCLGIPLFETDVRVVDTETFAEVPAGFQGEIFISSPYLFKGYWNRSEETAKVLVEHDGRLFFRTGDVGRIDEQGYFYIVDRMKRMVNASGYKVWPAEIEGMLHSHPAIREACVIGAKDPHRGETVKAVVALKAEFQGRVTQQEVIDWAREHMAAYKYPRLVEFVDALPLTPTGKVDWRTLQERESASVGAAP